MNNTQLNSMRSLISWVSSDSHQPLCAMKPPNNYHLSSKALLTLRLTSFSKNRPTSASKIFIGWYLIAFTSESRYRKIASKNWWSYSLLLSPPQTTQTDSRTISKSVAFLDASIKCISKWTSRYMKSSRKWDKRQSLLNSISSLRSSG